MRTSHATVPTDRADRYAKQLVSHLGRKAGFSVVADGHRLKLSAGTCLVRTTEAGLELVAEADSEQALRAVEDVVSRHLERFGQRNELHVVWVTDTP
jgi:hypothetical protein